MCTVIDNNTSRFGSLDTDWYVENMTREMTQYRMSLDVSVSTYSYKRCNKHPVLIIDMAQLVGNLIFFSSKDSNGM